MNKKALILPGSFRTDFRDNSSMKHAKTSLAAYEGSAVHAARDFLVANNHKQEGDPEKAAAFLYRIIESGKLPKRILIGKKCCEDVNRIILVSIVSHASLTVVSHADVPGSVSQSCFAKTR